MSFISELKRRNVIRVGTAYVVVAWLLIQVAETIFPLFGMGDAPARIVVIVLATGFIPVLVISWAFELTPEGLKRDSEIDPARSLAPQAGKRLDRIIMVVLALAVSFFAFDKFVLDPAEDAEIAEEAAREARTEALVESYGDQSIVVLPFADMSPEGDQEYFSDGLAEELLNLLARIRELRVISRSSAFAFKDSNTPMPEIARQLNVQHVLEGSVRKAGNQLRVTAQLIDARSDTHLWSETYDETLDDIFAVQDAIAGKVVEQLHITLLGDAPRSRVVDPRAYELYLQGRHVRQTQRDAAGALRAEELQRAALAIEPDYVDALLELRRAYSSQRFYVGLKSQDAVESLMAMAEVLNKVEALDPDHPVIALERAYEALQAGRFQEYASRVAETYNAAPKSEAGFWTYIVLRQLGRYDEAAAVQNYYLARDPTSCAAYSNLSEVWWITGDYERVIEDGEKALELCPSNHHRHHRNGMAHALLGRYPEALEELAMEPGVVRLHGLATVHHLMGEPTLSDQYLEELKNSSTPGGQPSYYFVASAYAFRGDADAAFEWLERIDDQEREHEWNSPWFRPISDDPRWAQAVDKYGWTREELAAIEFDVDIPR